jgi:glycolate oxidase FAD binding subunit
MTVPTATLDALGDSVRPGRARPPEDYAIDGVAPARAFRPETRDEVARLLATCDASRLAVVPLGARTAIGLGRPLEAYDVALDTTALDRVVDYEPADLTITVEAGMTLARLQQVLGEQGQFLPADPPPSDEVTIGGLLATARPGAWRGHLPGARDLVLGVTVATPAGTLVHSGGRVVKNVSGYDMHRMHTGALGAFGVIVEATFKLAPRPPATRSFAVQCTDLLQASEAAYRFWDAALPLRALSLLAPDAARAAGLPAAPHVLLACGGAEPVLARCEEAVRQEARALGVTGGEALDGTPWTALRRLAGDLDATVLRLSVPSSRLDAAVDAAAAYGTAWGHLASGSVLLHAPTLDADTVRALRTRARNVGGSLQIESAPVALRSAVDPFEASEPTLVRALKREFDPHGTLNRGRWQEQV